MKKSVAIGFFCLAYLILGGAIRFYEELSPLISSYLDEGTLCLINLLGLGLVAFEVTKTRIGHTRNLPLPILVLVYVVSFLLFDGSVSNVLGERETSIAICNYWISAGFILVVGFSISAQLLLLLNCLFSLYTVAGQIGFFPDITLVSILFGVSVLLFSFRLARLFDSSSTDLFTTQSLVIWLNVATGLIYFFPGVGKIVISPTGIEWIMENRLTHLIATACNFNWDISCQALSNYRFLDSISPITNVCVLVMEFASLFFLPGIVQAVICVTRIFFHLVEVGLNGDVFWGMIFINSILVILNLGWIKNTSITWDSQRLFHHSIILTLVAVINFSTPLYWFDIPVNNKYIISVVDDKNKTWILSPSFFGGYSSYFLYDVLVDFHPPGAPVLTYGVGETGSYQVLRSLQKIKSVEDLEKWNSNSAEKADPNPKVKEFVVNLISKQIAQSCGQSFQKSPKIPRLFPHYLPRNYAENEARLNSSQDCAELKIKRFQIDFQESLYLDGKIIPTRTQTLFTKSL